MVVSAGLATFAELETIFGQEDLHDMLEIVRVDAYNRAVMREARAAAEHRGR